MALAHAQASGAAQAAGRDPALADRDIKPGWRGARWHGPQHLLDVMGCRRAARRGADHGIAAARRPAGCRAGTQFRKPMSL
ncbi:MAG: hypothetical protein JNL89_11395 [Rhodanobacteraceae bacterium]|nr:hypothetical protein [Rhodanobacteraceae bacterium]